MTDTPRTNAIAHRGYNESAYIAEMTNLARQMERELADERALADRLAGSFENVLSDWLENYNSDETSSCHNGVRALAAWKESRHV